MEILALPIALLVVFISTLVRRRAVRNQVARDIDAWAQALGMIRVGNDLHGMRRGVPVGARLALEKKGHEMPRWTLLARLAPPLDLGLMIHPREEGFDDVTGGAPIVPTGDNEFDMRFTVRGDEPERVRALLDQPLRQLLLRTLHPNAVFILSDQGAAFHMHVRSEPAWLERALDIAATIVHGVNHARDNVPVASALAEHRSAWAAFAQRNALTGISAPLCMWGQMADSTVYAYAVRLAPEQYCLEVWLRFEEPLALGLLIQPMRTLDRFKDMFSEVDHEVGDPLFDDTFLVRVSDAAGVDALLDQETRGKLLTLNNSLGPLSLTDEGLLARLPHVPRDPAVVPSMVGELLGLAGHLAARRARQRAGPYR